MINQDSLIRQSAAPLGTLLDGEVVLMSAARGRYYGFDLIASDIWQRLATPCRVGDLCAALADAYDGAPEEIAADVIALLTQLRDEALIEVIE